MALLLHDPGVTGGAAPIQHLHDACSTSLGPQIRLGKTSMIVTRSWAIRALGDNWKALLPLQDVAYRPAPSPVAADFSPDAERIVARLECQAKGAPDLAPRHPQTSGSSVLARTPAAESSKSAPSSAGRG